MPASGLKRRRPGQSSTMKSKSKDEFAVSISTMDAKLEFCISNKSKGSDLYELVCQTIGLRETWYFGINFTDSHGLQLWLRPDKKVLSQDIPKESPIPFRFSVKFYPESVEEELIQEVTQHLFFLQVKESILNTDWYCPPEAAVLLASYAVQAQYGDYEDAIFSSDSPDRVIMEDLLPQRVIDQYQMTTDMWEEKIKTYYADHSSMPREEARMEYLKIVQDLDMYGVSFFDITKSKGKPLCLGVDCQGIYMYDCDNKLTPKISFPWSEIKNISTRDKKFTIKPVDKKAPDIVFYAPKHKINKTILELCVGNHELYMRRRKPDSMEVQQMKAESKEEKEKRRAEKIRLAHERQAKEEALREKEEAERKLLATQEELRLYKENLMRSEETADILAEKARAHEEEAILLKQKVIEADRDLKLLKNAAFKIEQERVLIEEKMRENELMTLDDLERRELEVKELRAELLEARQEEKEAKEKIQELSRHVPPYDAFYRPTSPQSYSIGMLANEISELGINTSNLTMVDHDPMEDVQLHDEFQSVALEELQSVPYDELARQVELEGEEYNMTAKQIKQQLKELKYQMDGFKIEEKQSHLDKLHEMKSQNGETKFKTLQKIKSGTTKARVAFFEDL